MNHNFLYKENIALVYRQLSVVLAQFHWVRVWKHKQVGILWLKSLICQARLKYSKVLDLRLPLKYPVQLSWKLEYTGENEIPFRKRKTENQDKRTEIENKSIYKCTVIFLHNNSVSRSQGQMFISYKMIWRFFDIKVLILVDLSVIFWDLSVIFRTYGKYQVFWNFVLIENTREIIKQIEDIKKMTYCG